MADRTNGDGEVTAGVRRLAADAGVSVGTVSAGVRALMDAGLYAVVATGRGRRPTTYRFVSSTVNANPVDNNGVAFTGEHTIAFSENGVAFKSDPRSVQIRDAYKEEPYIEPERSARELTENVDGLRRLLRPGP
jgi:hypothetical protein